MANKKYFWLKLKEDFFRDKRIKKLRRIAGGDTFTIIYLKLQLLSLKNNGVLIYEGIENTFAEEMALDIDEDIDNVKVTISFLQQNGLLDEMGEGNYVMTETIQCIGSEGASAERVRKHREGQKLKALQCNTQVTISNIEIEKEKEIELELEKDIDKKKKEKKIASTPIYFENKSLNNLFIEYLELRKKLKAVNSERAIKMLINELNKYDDPTKVKMIENSIINSWKSVYPLKEKNQKHIDNKDNIIIYDAPKVEYNEDEYKKLEEEFKGEL